MSAGMDRLQTMWAELEADRNGWVRKQTWNCEDGWFVGYTTEPLHGGPADETGRFIAFAYQPYGKGARTSPTQWKLHYRRAFRKRKDARARAEVLYYKHSPKMAKRHGRAS